MLVDKIVPWSHVGHWVRAKKLFPWHKVVVTNGCFDLLHAGHIAYLTAAKKLGTWLLVGINDDESVQTLKGPNRPINNERNRQIVVAALECVDMTCIFPGITAVEFLQKTAPNFWVKGGDYTKESLNPVEREMVNMNGGKIVIIPMTTNISSTTILSRL